MWASLRRLVAITAILLLSVATVDAGDNEGKNRPPVRGPIFDITHFDVIPLTEDHVDFQQTAYKALFDYRDASKSDPGFESFRVVNWLLASNHSQIIDVWRSLDAFEAHLAQQHSVDFRFAVQVQPPPPLPGSTAASAAQSTTANTARWHRSICPGQATLCPRAWGRTIVRCLS